jgi:hypothetical protein
LDTYGSRENCIFMSKISRNSSIRWNSWRLGQR